MEAFNPKLYAWAPVDESTWQRRPVASESLWVQRSYSDRSLYVTGTFVLIKPRKFQEIESIAKLAWYRLRWLYPEMGLQANIKERALEYHVPADNHEMLNWLDKTVKVIPHFSRQGVDGIELEETIEKVESVWSENGAALDQMSYLCFLTAPPQDDDKSIHQVEILFRLDHLCMDGIGARILAGKFFKLFEEVASGFREPSSELELSQDWDLSVKNLSPSWAEIMNDEQLVEGPDFNQAVGQQEKLLLEDVPRNLGLPFSPPSKVPSHQYGFYNHTMSKSDSAALIDAIKKLLPPGTTVTHLAHAAMVLALLRANAALSSKIQATEQPQSQVAEAFHSPCFLSARRCIQPTATCVTPTQEYIPICQGLGEVKFADLSSYIVPINSPPSIVLDTLLRACTEATKSYLAIKERKSILTETAPLMHKLSERLATQKDVNTQPGEVALKADPYLLSDGISEKYIANTYSNFTLQSLHFAAAPSSSNLIIRLSSWGDEITVGAEWKLQLYGKDMVKDFIADIVSMMLLVRQS